MIAKRSETQNVSQETSEDDPLAAETKKALARVRRLDGGQLVSKYWDLGDLLLRKYEELAAQHGREEAKKLWSKWSKGITAEAADKNRIYRAAGLRIYYPSQAEAANAKTLVESCKAMEKAKRLNPAAYFFSCPKRRPRNAGRKGRKGDKKDASLQAGATMLPESPNDLAMELLHRFGNDRRKAVGLLHKTAEKIRGVKPEPEASSETGGPSPDLIAAADRQYQVLSSSEQEAVTAYCRFGELIEELRPNYSGADWSALLSTHEWDYTVAKRARTAHRRRADGPPESSRLIEALGYKPREEERWASEDAEETKAGRLLRRFTPPKWLRSEMGRICPVIAEYEHCYLGAPPEYWPETSREYVRDPQWFRKGRWHVFATRAEAEAAKAEGDDIAAAHTDDSLHGDGPGSQPVSNTSGDIALTSKENGREPKRGQPSATKQRKPKNKYLIVDGQTFLIERETKSSYWANGQWYHKRRSKGLKVVSRKPADAPQQTN